MTSQMFMADRKIAHSLQTDLQTPDFKITTIHRQAIKSVVIKN